MPWYREPIMSQKQEFVGMAEISDNLSDACRRFGISRKTGYKWLARYQLSGLIGLEDRSRRPRYSPRKTSEIMEKKILEARLKHPAWGGRKLKRWLEDRGAEGLPAPSTVTEILRRHGQIDPEESRKREPLKRFECPEPNDFWQMDFKGPFLVDSQPCHPLTVLDDHSRFSVSLKACEDHMRDTVKRHLCEAFETYGLPRAMLVDNGGPWAAGNMGEWTKLSVWLLRLGVDVIRTRIRHPQTLGKDERFNKTLLIECITGYVFSTFIQVQKHFDQWRDIYNFERPHESLGLKTPASRYRPSPRLYSSNLPPIEYESGDEIRNVKKSGKFSFHGRYWIVGKAFSGYPVGIRPSQEDGRFSVYFCQQRIREIDLRNLSVR
jgi:transposase InsO family protein